MKKLYIYIRLSNADDDLKFKTESESIANQRTLIYRYIQSRREFDAYEPVEFVDDGFSGTNGHRPSFERMIECLKNGESDAVICKDFSRFFRDYVEIGDYLERIFPFLGVRFIAINDGYDSDEYKGTTAGMEVVMKYIVYAYYSRDLSQKVKTVMQTRKSKGEFISAYTPYGYMKNPDVKRTIMLDPETAPIVRRIFDMALGGKRTSEIARALNDEKIETPSAYYMRKHPTSKKFRKTSSEACWTLINVREILLRREYSGVMVLNQRTWKGLDNPHSTWNDKSEWQILPNTHEGIVTEEEYEAAQNVFRKITARSHGTKQYLLRSLIRCAVCGRIMERKESVKGNFFHCIKSRTSRETTCPIEERFSEAELERIVQNSLLEQLHILVEADDRLKQTAATVKGTEENLHSRLEQIDKRLKQISLSRVTDYESYAEGRLNREAFLARKENLSAESDKLETEKSNLEQKLATTPQSKNPATKETVTKARETISADAITNEMLLYFIDRANIYSGMRVEIIYRFTDEIANILKNH